MVNYNECIKESIKEIKIDIKTFIKKHIIKKLKIRKTFRYCKRKSSSVKITITRQPNYMIREITI